MQPNPVVLTTKALLDGQKLVAYQTGYRCLLRLQFSILNILLLPEFFYYSRNRKNMKDFFIFIAGIDKIEYFDFFRSPYFLVFLSRARSRLWRRKIEMGFRVEKSQSASKVALSIIQFLKKLNLVPVKSKKLLTLLASAASHRD